MYRWFDSAPDYHLPRALILQGFSFSGGAGAPDKVVHLYEVDHAASLLPASLPARDLLLSHRRAAPSHRPSTSASTCDP